jgi:hypothetical protein
MIDLISSESKLIEYFIIVILQTHVKEVELTIQVLLSSIPQSQHQ